MVVEAMNQLMDILAIQKSANGPKRLCVLFRPVRPTDAQPLLVQYGGGCSASVGYNGNSDNTLNLSPTGCFHRGVIYHELLHNLGTCIDRWLQNDGSEPIHVICLGFFHEQSRADRDSYVTIQYANIEENKVSFVFLPKDGSSLWWFRLGT